MFIFIAVKMISFCWSQGTSKRSVTASTAVTTTTAISHNEQNGTTKLTNHSNNLLIISSYNGSISKVSIVISLLWFLTILMVAA